MHTLPRRIGARGAMLLALSALWVVLFVAPIHSGTTTGSDVFYHEWPTTLRLALWYGTIGAALIAAFVPPRKDWFGWAALTIMPMQRLIAWALAWVERLLPGGRTGDPDAGRFALLYLLIILVIWIAAAMRPPALEQGELDT